MSVWENVIDRGGSPVVDLRRANGAPQIDIKVVYEPGGSNDFAGWGSCDDRVLELNDNTVGDAQSQNGIAAHEFGHILGLSHVSQDDNLPSGAAVPSMIAGTCAPAGFDPADLQSLTIDDRAALTNRQGGGGSSGFQSDPSFETAASNGTYFSVQNATSSRVNSASSPAGNFYLEFLGNQAVTGSDPYVLQEEVAGYARSIDAAAYVRKAQESDDGSVFLRLLTRGVELSGTNFDWNNPPNPEARCLVNWSGDWTVRKETLFYPTNSWAQYSTPTLDTTGDVLGIRVSIVSDLTWDCPGPGLCRADTRVDDVKVRER